MEETGGLKKVHITEETKELSGNSNKLNLYLIIRGIAILISLAILLYKKLTINKDPHHYDYIIVGSGLYGATFNYLAKKRGKKTLVIERRNVTGGNLYCDKVEDIFVHKYGPHVFHTDNAPTSNY